MANATTNRPKTQAKDDTPKRLVRWLHRVSWATGYLRIVTDAHKKTPAVGIYSVRPLPAVDFGPAVEVTKLKLGDDGMPTGEDEAVYHVNLDGHGSCTCPGGSYRNKCRHLDALSHLEGIGKL